MNTDMNIKLFLNKHLSQITLNISKWAKFNTKTTLSHKLAYKSTWNYTLYLIFSISFFITSCKLGDDDIEDDQSKNTIKEPIKEHLLSKDNKLMEDASKKDMNIIDSKKAAGDNIDETDENMDDIDTDDTDTENIPDIEETDDESTGDEDIDKDGYEDIDDDTENDFNESDLEDNTIDDEAIDSLHTKHPCSTNSNINISVNNEPSQIALPENQEGRLLPTVNIDYTNGVGKLSSEYKNLKYFEDSDRRITKRARAYMKGRFTRLANILYCHKDSKNKGMTPIDFEVLLHKIKPPKASYFRFFRKPAQRRIMATRAVCAYKKTALDPGNYKQTALVKILRKKSESEKKKPPGCFFKNLPKAVKICINEGSEPIPIFREKLTIDEAKERKKHLTNQKTNLQLIEVIVNKKGPYHNNTFIYNKMQELDESTLFCYNSRIHHPENPKLIKKNHPLIFKPICSYRFIGSLDSIPENAYNLKSKRFSRAKKIKKAIKKKISPKYMIFASENIYDDEKHPHKEPIMPMLEDKPPEAERLRFWRLTIGNVCVGVVPAASKFKLGASHWNNSSGKGRFLKKLTSKFTSWWDKMLNKLELGLTI